jgi:uncharacterized membrane protein YfcA
VDWSPIILVAIAAIGLVGGTLGGLLGLGGSVFIIPTITILLGPNYHLYQAAALITNVCVAAAATRKHRGRGTIRTDVVPTMSAIGGCAALLGVSLSNTVPTGWLHIGFGTFVCYASAAELLALARRKPDAPDAKAGGALWMLACCAGGIAGFVSGLLGIGGGAVMVPILRRFGRFSLKQAVASSACAMIPICFVGAIWKNASIPALEAAGRTEATLSDSLGLAAVLSPAAIVGATIGAALIYRLPAGAIRAILSLLLAYVGVRMVIAGLAG